MRAYFFKPLTGTGTRTKPSTTTSRSMGREAICVGGLGLCVVGVDERQPVFRTTSARRTNPAGDRRCVQKQGRHCRMGEMAHQGNPWVVVALQACQRKEGPWPSDPPISSRCPKERLLCGVPDHGHDAPPAQQRADQTDPCCGAKWPNEGVPMKSRLPEAASFAS